MESAIQLLTVLIIFALVLVVTYFTTRWIGNYQKGRSRGRNIELLDAGQLSQNQYIQLVRVGEKYLILAVSKDNVTLLGESSRDELQLDEPGDDGRQNSADSFQKLLEAAKSKLPHK